MPTPQDLKDLIVQKYPDGVSSDGTPYVQMDATKLAQSVASKFPTGVTSAGVKYSDYLPKPTLPTGVGAETAVAPATPVAQQPKSVLSAVGDGLKAIPNAVGDVAGLAKDLTYGTLKKVFVDIPTQVSGLIKDSGGIMPALRYFNESLAPKELTNNTAKIVWSMVPNSLKALANTDAISKIPAEFQGLVHDSGGYLNAFKNLVSVTPNLPDVVHQYAQQVDKATQSIVNHPVNEALGYAGLKYIADNPAGALDEATKAVKDFSANPVGALSDVKTEVGQVLNDLSTTIKAKTVDPLQQKAVDSIAQAYRDTASGTVRTSNTLARSVARGKDPAQFLAENNIVPDIKDGKIQSITQADSLHQSARPLNEALDTALEQVDKTAPKVSLAEIEAQAIKGVRSEANINKNVANQLEADVKREFADYKLNFGDEVTLKQLNGIKRGKWSTTPFDSTKPYQGTVNYEIGKAAKGIIENRVPKDAFGVRELNDHIGSIYESEKFLRSLNRKTVKGGRLGKYFGGAIGASVGAGLGAATGIPVLPEIGGMLGGRYVTELLQQSTFSNPVKELILRNLQTKDPAAYVQVQEYIKKAKASQEAPQAGAAPTMQ